MENRNEVDLPDDAALAAWQLLARTPFADRALAAGQRRIRLLFASFSRTVTEIIIQLLRISIFEGMEPIRIDILCDDRQSAADGIIGRAPNLRHMLAGAGTGEGLPLAWAGRIHLYEEGPAGLVHASGSGDRLAADGPFTAIVIAGDDLAGNVGIALSIRPWTALHPAFAAPIYVRAGAAENLGATCIRYDGIRPKPGSGLLSRIDGSTDAADVIEPFGAPEELRSPDLLFGGREQLARRLHDAYRQRRREALARQGATSRTDLPGWKDLDETYRQANRRAADFIPSVRLAAGVPDWWNRDAGLPRRFVNDPRSLEKLARMAHKSWRADRELDGWQPAAERDSPRRLHTDLVDYDELSEEKKELDREQIRLFADLQPQQGS